MSLFLTTRGAASAVALLTVISLACAPLPAQTLSILNYDDYLDPGVVEDFERQHGAKVKMTYFESHLDRDQVMRTSGPEDFDLVLLGGDEAAARGHAGVLARLDRSKAPNLAHIDSRWTGAYEGVGEYCAAYFWGGSGIAYRADRVPEPPLSWAALLRPTDAWTGHIAMVSDGRELIGIGLKALGESSNASDRSILRAAGDLLLAQKPAVKSYHNISLTAQSELIAGDIWVAFSYNGDAAVLNELDSNIHFAYPSEGVALWVDYLCIVAGSTQPALALAFINFINDPANAARNAETVRYASPNKAALPLTSVSYRQSPFVFPPPEVLANSELNQPLPARAMKVVNEIQALLLKP